MLGETETRRGCTIDVYCIPCNVKHCSGWMVSFILHSLLNPCRKWICNHYLAKQPSTIFLLFAPLNSRRSRPTPRFCRDEHPPVRSILRTLPEILDNLITFPYLYMFQVAWIHVDRQMLVTIHKHVVAKIPRFSVTNDNHKTWQLNIRSVEQQDRGYYMCQVNTVPMISQVGYLQVVGQYWSCVSTFSIFTQIWPNFDTKSPTDFIACLLIPHGSRRSATIWWCQFDLQENHSRM